jgi:hypothetical protein
MAMSGMFNQFSFLGHKKSFECSMQLTFSTEVSFLNIISENIDACPILPQV